MDPRNSTPGIEAIERPMTAAESRLFAKDPGPGNPFVGRQPAAGPVTSPLRATPATPRAPLSAYDAGRAVRGFFNRPAMRGAVKLAGAVEAIGAGTDAVTDAQQGNFAGALDNGLRSAASVAATKSLPTALLSGAYFGGHALGTQAYNRMDDIQREGVGYAINKGLRTLGNVFGQDWGVDDSALLAERAPGAAAQAPSTRAASATPAAAQAPRAAAEPRDPQGMDPRPKSDQPVQAVNPNGTVTYDPETKTYSGTNVREGFTFNGSRNGGGNVSVVPGMSQAEIAATMSRPDPRLAEANRGALDFGPEPMIINAGRLGDDLRKGGKDSRGARMRDEMAMRERIADEQLRATLRGQDIGYAGQQLNADVSRRGQDITREGQLLSSETSRRGQDMSLYGQLLPKQMEMEMAARMRSLRAQYMEGGKGDPTTAAQLAARDGMADLAKQFMEQAQAEQTLGEGRSKAVDKLFENRFMTPGKDGTLIRREDLEAAARHSLMQQTGGEYANLPVAEQNRAAAEAYQRPRLLDGANALRGNVFTAMGLASPPPAYANLPTAEQVKGGSLQRLGWTDLDSWIPGGPGRGDYKLSTPKNGTIPLRGDTVDQAVLKNLLDQGVTLR